MKKANVLPCALALGLGICINGLFSSSQNIISKEEKYLKYLEKQIFSFEENIEAIEQAIDNQLEPDKKNKILRDVAIIHLEITQGIQDKKNSIPLIKGKPTVIRAFFVIADKNSSPIRGINAQLHIKRNGKELENSPIPPDNGPITITTKSLQRENSDNSLDFTLKEDWYNNDTEFWVELTKSDTNQENNRYPKEKTLVAKYKQSRKLIIRYIKVHYTNKNWKGERRPGSRVEKQATCDYFRSLYPIANKDVKYLPWPIEEIEFDKGDENGNLDAEALLQLLNSLYLTSHAKTDVKTDFLYAWTPKNSYPYRGRPDPVWANGAGYVAMGNDDDLSYRRTFAHEIGHLCGLLHTQRRLLEGEYGYDILNLYSSKTVLKHYPEKTKNITPKKLFDFMRGGEQELHCWVTPESYLDLYEVFVITKQIQQNSTLARENFLQLLQNPKMRDLAITVLENFTENELLTKDKFFTDLTNLLNQADRDTKSFLVNYLYNKYPQISDSKSQITEFPSDSYEVNKIDELIASTEKLYKQLGYSSTPTRELDISQKAYAVWYDITRVYWILGIEALDNEYGIKHHFLIPLSHNNLFATLQKTSNRQKAIEDRLEQLLKVVGLK